MRPIPDFKSSLLWAKTTLARPHVVRSYLALKRNERLSVDELAELNWRKRKRILQFAYEQVPYYHSKFDSVGLTPQDIRFREQWETVPVLEKSDLVKHFDELKAKDANPKWLRRSTTGGSTGVPVVLYLDRRVAIEPLRWRMLSWWGVGPGEDAAFAWRSFSWTKLEKVRREVLLWPTRRLYLDASLITTANLKIFVQQCQRIRPAMIQGYVGAIEAVADFVNDNAIHFPAPKAVWLTASPVSKTQRNKMQTAFRAPVYDQYGCGEIYQLAAQCAQSENLHMFSDTCCIEFLDVNRRGVEIGHTGQIALTDLDNFVFPLIRYLNGDGGSAVAGQCTCGVNLPLMGAVKGRVTDHLYLPDGGILAGDFLTTIFDEDPNCVKAFQVFQKKDRNIDVRVVMNLHEQNANERVAKVVAKLRARILGVVEVRAVPVDTIESDRGKTRYVISER